MPKDPSDRAGRYLALVPALVLAMPGCGDSTPPSGTAAPTKEALKRQNEMYKFMKEQGKKPKVAPDIPKKVG